MRDTLRRDSLRRQVDLLHDIRERMSRESEDDYESWAIALTPLTDRIFHELMALEGVAPYPHPIAFKWYEPAETA